MECKICKKEMNPRNKNYCSRKCRDLGWTTHKFCIFCGKERQVFTKKYCSKVCQGKDMRGVKSQNWVGDKVGYCGIHDWLQLNFGKANKCEQCGSFEKVQWAKLKDKSYERKRENFWQLCSKCHMDYDDTSIGNRPTWNKGRKWSAKVRKNISEGTKKGMERWRNKNIC